MGFGEELKRFRKDSRAGKDLTRNSKDVFFNQKDVLSCERMFLSEFEIRESLKLRNLQIRVTV